MKHNHWEDLARTLIPALRREKREFDPVFHPSDGYPEELRAEATELGLLISSFRKEWRLPSLPVDTWVPHVVLRWEDLDSEGEDLLRSTLREIRRKRIRSYRKCSYCRGLMPPEDLFDRTACMACATKHLGVVF